LPVRKIIATAAEVWSKSEMICKVKEPLEPEYPRMRDGQPKLWIHGHSHDRCDYTLGKTRVVANPLGYPNEPRSLEAFEPTFQVEV